MQISPFQGFLGLYLAFMFFLWFVYCIINCNFNLYTERNVFAKNFFLSFLATFFKIKKFILKKNP